jgi:hypothetical protein
MFSGFLNRFYGERGTCCRRCATDPAGGAGAPVADGGLGRDGVIGQLRYVELGDKKQGSGTWSGGRS